MMHQFSPASPKSLVLTVLRSFGLLSAPSRSLAGTWGTRKRVTRLVRPALAALRDENLCIIRASNLVCRKDTKSFGVSRHRQ